MPREKCPEKPQKVSREFALFSLQIAFANQEQPDLRNPNIFAARQMLYDDYKCSEIFCQPAFIYKISMAHERKRRRETSSTPPCEIRPHTLRYFVSLFYTQLRKIPRNSPCEVLIFKSKEMRRENQSIRCHLPPSPDDPFPIVSPIVLPAMPVF